MRVIAGAMLALWAALTPLRATAEDAVALDSPRGPGDLEITADEVEARARDGAEGTLTATGDVRVRTGGLLLRAPKLEFNRATRRAVLEGGVVGVDGLLVFSAERLATDLKDRSLLLEGGQLVVKSGVSAEELYAKATSDQPDSVRSAGRNALTIRADRFVRLEGPTFAVENVWLTTCASETGCGPFLSFSAERVEVTPSERALLEWWRVGIFSLRSPPIPIPLSLPLRVRAAGLLFPRLSLSGPGGVSVEVPVFLPLGDSYDLTLRARWFNGTALASSGGIGVRGVGDDTELRWRPAEESAGALRVSHYFDTSIAPDGGARGHRGAVGLTHRDVLLGGRFSLDGNLLSDTGVLLDTEADLRRSQLPYLRSTVAFARAFEHTSLALSGTQLQVLATQPPAARSALVDAPAAMAPLFRGDLLREGSLGPAHLEAQATLIDEESLWGVRQAGRARRLLAALSLAQALPLATGRGGSLALELGERVDVASGPGQPDLPFRAGGFAGLAARTRIEGRLGGWAHDLVPSVRARALSDFGLARPFSSGLFAPLPTSPAPPGSTSPQADLDAALPPGQNLQVVSRLATSLSKDDARFELWAEHHLGVVLGPGSGVDRGQLHLGAAGGFAISRLRLSPTLVFVRDLELGALALLSGRVGGTVGEGSGSVGLQSYQGAQSDQLARGLDALFTPRALMPDLVRPPELLIIDGQLDLPLLTGLRLQLGAAFTESTPQDRSQAPTRTQQYGAGLRYDAGGCATFSATARWTPNVAVPRLWDQLQFLFAFELGDLGAVAAQAASAGPDLR